MIRSMRLHSALLIPSLLVIRIATAQSNQDFSGVWKLNASRSEIRGLPTPAAFLKVEQSATSMMLSASSDESGEPTTSIYPLDERSEKGRGTDTRTKWEGAALLVNTLVSGPQNYTVMERWTRSRDRSTLSIKRTIVRLGSES